MDQPNQFFAFPKETSALLRSCVHCGLCLGTCPTYRENGNENDSPRGRLYLMRGLSEGRLQPSPEIASHLDLCLDCRACETACPSGVQYGTILESARESMLKARPPGLFSALLRAFFLKSVMPRPAVLGLVTKVIRLQQRLGLRDAIRASGVLKLFPKRLQELESQQPEIKEPAFLENAADVFPADGPEPKKRVAFFAGCVMDQFMGDIHRATVKVLQAYGVEVLATKGQVCCGALMIHSGEGEIARKLARENISIFHGLKIDAVVNNSAGCGAQLKDYHHLLHNDLAAKEFSAKVQDVSQVLAGLEAVHALKPLNKSVCYDAPCHLHHAQKITTQPIALLKQIPGIRWIDLPDADFCCGAAGIYNLTQPEMSSKILARKVEAIKNTGAEIVTTGNPGCLLQIRNGCKAAGLPCEVLHPMELLSRQLAE